MVEGVVKYLGTVAVAGLSATITVGITIGVLRSDVSALISRESAREEAYRNTESRIIHALGDFKKDMGKDIGALETEVRLLKEEIRRKE